MKISVSLIFLGVSLLFGSAVSRELTAEDFRSKLGSVGLNTTVVNSPAGSFTGFLEGDYVAKFLGMPFAAPPVGSNRFRGPQPVAVVSGYDATYFRPACAQSDNSLVPIDSISEDCLYLNVYAPQDALNGKKGNGPYAVLLFLYGGSWAMGSSSLVLYDGTFNVAQYKDVIIVTSNYRLDLFGWAASDALKAEDPEGSSGNAGLQDQRAALRWIQQNIASFGGDPTRVTLWGQSAGAASTSAHLVTPRSKGLFTRSWSESGPWSDWTARSWEDATAHTARVAQALNCEGDSGQILACLRAASMEDLIKHKENTPHEVVHWQPTVDGVELTDTPQNLGKKGEFNKEVDIICGSTVDEASTFMDSYMMPKDANATVYAEHLKTLVGTLADGVMKLYPPENYKLPWWGAVDAFSDGMFSCPSRRMARWASANGAKSSRLYYFTWEILLARVDKWLGVFHGSDLPFLWDIPDLLIGPEGGLADAMSSYITRLAVTGDVNTDKYPFWPTYNATSDLHMELNPFSLAAKSGLKAAKCDWWDKVLEAGCHPYPLGHTCANPPPVDGALVRAVSRLGKTNIKK